MVDDKYNEYVKKVKALSIYDIRIVYDKLYKLPIHNDNKIKDLHIEAFLMNYDIVDLILIKHYMKTRKNNIMFRL